MEKEIFDDNYAVICDAGSSGTRLFVYKFQKPNEDELIEIKSFQFNNEPVVKKIQPGMSSFGENPEKVIEYLTPLLKYAENRLPKEKISKIPLFIFATAGMRLLPKLQKEAIIKVLRENLSTVTNFKISNENIQVINGAWEGIYSWIAANYILGKLRPEFKGKTNGMAEMGGASVQLTYELDENNHFLNENVIKINLNPNQNSKKFEYQLFSTTFLGFGTNEGLKKYENYILSNEINQQKSIIDSSCFPKNFMKQIKTENQNQKLIRGTGEWNLCVQHLKNMKLEENNEKCQYSECYLNYVPAPNINLSDMNIYGFSEYWYTTSSFGSSGRYDYDQFKNSAIQFCSQNWTDILEKFENQELLNMEKEQLEINCFKAAWIIFILHDGMKINREKNNFQTVLEIDGEEVQWTLGALIYNLRTFSNNLKSD